MAIIEGLEFYNGTFKEYDENGELIYEGISPLGIRRRRRRRGPIDSI